MRPTCNRDRLRTAARCTVLCLSGVRQSFSCCSLRTKTQFMVDLLWSRLRASLASAKTALCTQLAGYVSSRGGRALWGHCAEMDSLSLAYLPIVQALEAYASSADTAELRGDLGSSASAVARIVPQIRQRLSVDFEPAGDPDEDRWRLFQAVITLLRSGAARQPMVLVLEDLYEALDAPRKSFNVAHFSNVLRYLREPERAVQLAFRSLKPGGMVAASEGYLAANWAGGPYADSVMLVVRVLQDENKAQGGDPLMGGRLRALLRQSGFERIVSKPGCSAALSDSKASGAMIRAGWSGNLQADFGAAWDHRGAMRSVDRGDLDLG